MRGAGGASRLRSGISATRRRPFALRRGHCGVARRFVGGHAKAQSHLTPLLEKAGIGWDTPLSTLAPRLREQLLHGSGKRFDGVLTMLEKEYATTLNESRRERLEALRGEVACKECGGSRLRPEARSVYIAGKAIPRLRPCRWATLRECGDLGIWGFRTYSARSARGIARANRPTRSVRSTYCPNPKIPKSLIPKSLRLQI